MMLKKSNKTKINRRVKNKPLKKNTDAILPDEAALNLLLSSKINLTEERIVYFYLYFPIEENARSAEVELKDSGFIIETISSSSRNEWLCLVSKSVLPDSPTLLFLHKKLETLAHKFDGTYDGWETEISPDEAADFLY